MTGQIVDNSTKNAAAGFHPQSPTSEAVTSQTTYHARKLMTQKVKTALLTIIDVANYY